jgi:hypothetical protein
VQAASSPADDLGDLQRIALGRVFYVGSGSRLWLICSTQQPMGSAS